GDREARRANVAPLVFSGSASRVPAMGKPQAPRVRVFEYALSGGWKVLAGRTDEDNDRLSLKIARANDWWFHVHGMPGSHVILAGADGEEPDRQTLKAAAAIAAYHSKAREAGVVPVSCTQAKNVSKPHGAKPGTVTIRKEIVLKVRPSIADAVAVAGEP